MNQTKNHFLIFKEVYLKIRSLKKVGIDDIASAKIMMYPNSRVFLGSTVVQCKKTLNKVTFLAKSRDYYIYHLARL